MRVLGTRFPVRSVEPPCLPVNKIAKDLFMCFVDEILVQAKKGFANDE